MGGISVENGSFSPLLTTLEDFAVLRGMEMLVSGRYPFVSQLGAEFVPTLFARAWPGGELEPSAYQALKSEFLGRLESAGPVDGIYLDLHGAMKVFDMDDAEADLVRTVRQVVGPDVLISASMDLHGNISQDFVSQIDMLTAYRTAPHRDMLATREKACRMLVDAIASRQRPCVVCEPISVLLPGERTRTDMAPGDRLWASLSTMEEQSGILDASLFVGFMWVDEPRAHAAAVVTALDHDLARREAATLARDYWDAREEFEYGVTVGTIDECIEWAESATESTVFISDSGDNPTAGATGDIPLFVERLLAHQAESAVVAAIPDAVTVEECVRAGVGAAVDINLGGKLDTLHGSPLALRAAVQSIVSDNLEAGTQVVLCADNVHVIVTQRRKPFTTVDDFAHVGLDPLDFKIVVVKLGYLFPDLLRIAPRVLMALSPGASDLDMRRLPFKRIERPMWPLDS